MKKKVFALVLSLFILTALMPVHVSAQGEVTYTVMFAANEGTGAQMASQDFIYNSGAHLQKCTYTRTGYDFSGWNIKADGSGTPLKDEANGSLLSAAETNVTLYAQWTPIRYKITYNLDGGTIPQGEDNPPEYKVNTPDFTIYNPVREGYKFLGWAGTGIQGFVIELLIKMGSTDNREYKAVWEAKTYDIEFKPGSHGSITGSGGSTISSHTAYRQYNTGFPEFNTDTSLDGQTLTAEAGYTFAGWKDENGNAPGAKVTGDASYTAQWTANTNTAYKVQFLSQNNSGTVVSFDVIRKEASKTGTTDAVVDISALVKDYPIPGYYYIDKAEYYNTSRGDILAPVGQNGVQIAGDGTLVIRLYYAENDRTHLTITVNNTKRGHLENFPNGMFLPPATGKAENVNVEVVPGCTFEKWVYTDKAHPIQTDVPNATSSTLTGAQIDAVAKDTGIYEPITFTAIITEPTATYNYSVSSAGGGTVTKDTETIDAVTGEAAGSTAVPATGYDFEKWIYTTDGTTASTSAAFVPSREGAAYASKDYEAVFKKQTFAVNASAAPLGSGTVTGTGTFEYGTGTTLTAAPAAGYHFSSWSLNGMPAGTDASLVISNIKEIRNYTAQFEGNQYTIKFNKNFEGSGAMNDETFKYGTSKNLTANSFERAGYTFSSWNTRDDGNGTSFADTADIAKINLATAAADNTITLYAQWTLVSYHINYVLNGGTNNQINPDTYNAESDITLADPTRTGYTFAGWTGSNGTTAQRSVHIQTGSSGNKSYTAAWTANRYVVQFNANGGGGAMDHEQMTYDEWKQLTAQNYSRTGYYFIGWSTSADGSAAYSDNQSVKNLVSDPSTDGTSSITLYAQWRINPDTSAARIIQEEGINEIPDDIKKRTDLNLDTPAKIDNAMRITINNADSNIQADNIKVYEVKLQFSTDDGKTWINATKDNFPKEGITFTLQYPEGAGADDDFKIIHMFTTGPHAGETETLSYVKTSEGLQIHVNSLSPFAIGYIKKADTPAAVPDPSKPEEYIRPDISGQDAGHVFDKTGESYDAPDTGDKSAAGSGIAAWTFMISMLLSAAVFLSMKRKKERNK